MNSKKPNKLKQLVKNKIATLSKKDFHKLDFEKLSPDQIKEVLEESSKELEANAYYVAKDFNEKGTEGTLEKTPNLPPWIHFT